MTPITLPLFDYATCVESSFINTYTLFGMNNEFGKDLACIYDFVVSSLDADTVSHESLSTTSTDRSYSNCGQTLVMDLSNDNEDEHMLEGVQAT